MPRKVAAVVNVIKPHNIAEVNAFLGMVKYYHKFIPNHSTLLQPFNDLLHLTSHGNGQINVMEHSK